MGDHDTVESSESFTFPLTIRTLTPGQRSVRDVFQRSSLGVLGQFGESSDGMCDSGEGPTGASLSGLEESPLQAEHWSTAEAPLEKALTQAYQTDWDFHYHQQGALDSSTTTGDQPQRLDSFSEAFFRRNVSRIHGSDQGGIFGMGALLKGNGGYGGVLDSPSPPPSLSIPLVLSPPPTPLPPAALSPPRRVPQFVAGQATNQSQLLMQTDVSQQFFPCQSPVFVGKYPHSHWLQLSANQNGGGDITSPLTQVRAPNSSLMFQEEAGFHLRQLSSTQRNDYGSADCGLQISPSPPLAQCPQACGKLQLGHDPMTSADHVTWSQMGTSPSPLCPPPLQFCSQAEDQRAGEGAKTCHGSEVMQNKFLGYSGTQSVLPVTDARSPFRSALQTARDAGEAGGTFRPRYTPLPMLDPQRGGTGLFCRLLPPVCDPIGALWTPAKSEADAPRRCVNIGPEFQAILPDLKTTKGPEEPLREVLLWKPWEGLAESDALQEQVENLLDLCTSTALPGGGANLEVALHCLSHCQGNTLAALEMLLCSHTPPSQDYHYSGSDAWMLSETRLFHKAFQMYGKDFSRIHRMVRTKQVPQCVEFYYLLKKLTEKQRRQREQERQQGMEGVMGVTTDNRALQTSKTVTQLGLQDGIRAPTVATSFPCKQCGKMFYKIKSRNAHMKIHRQQQEDWRDRCPLAGRSPTASHPIQPQGAANALGHQSHLLTQTLLQNLVQSQAHHALLLNSLTKAQGDAIATATNSLNASPNPAAFSRSPPVQLYNTPQPAWDSFPVTSDSASVYYDPDGKAMEGLSGNGKDPVQWQQQL